MNRPALTADEHLALALDHIEAAGLALQIERHQNGCNWLRMEVKTRVQSAQKATETARFATSELLEMG